MDGFCSECRKPCREVKRDFGYGRTEYWGAVSSHENWHVVSECCDGDVLTQEQMEEINELNSASGGVEQLGPG
jgi:hypothetical protein